MRAGQNPDVHGVRLIKQQKGFVQCLSRGAINSVSHFRAINRDGENPVLNFCMNFGQ
jgi:hypothetical protein